MKCGNTILTETSTTSTDVVPESSYIPTNDLDDEKIEKIVSPDENNSSRWKLFQAKGIELSHNNALSPIELKNDENRQNVIEKIISSVRFLQNNGKKIISQVDEDCQEALQKIRKQFSNQDTNVMNDSVALHSCKFRPPCKHLLWGTSNAEEHYNKIESCLKEAQFLKGRHGLEKCGFQYKAFPCEIHRGDERLNLEQNEAIDKALELFAKNDKKPKIENKKQFNIEECNGKSTLILPDVEECHGYSTRLHHIETGAIITESNQKDFIADGQMYEVITRLCQEAAQEYMILTGGLKWVTLCDGDDKKMPIRALVSEYFDYEENNDAFQQLEPTLVVVTGKGKVQAGIFSRQHLVRTSIEASTAIGLVREASKRKMRTVLLDPNARTDREGMATFTKSIECLYGNGVIQNVHANGKISSTKSLFILAHSQSGAQLVRYLREQNDLTFADRIRAIVFTDSTHSIQWVKHNTSLCSFIQSDRCLYVKSANPQHDDAWDQRKPGETVIADNFWDHRFGKIRTIWAGTAEHSLTNWFARDFIWDHFDRHSDSVK